MRCRAVGTSGWSVLQSLGRQPRCSAWYALDASQEVLEAGAVGPVAASSAMAIVASRTSETSASISASFEGNRR